MSWKNGLERRVYVARALTAACIVAAGCARTPESRVETALDLVPADAAIVVGVDDLDALTARLEVDTLRAQHAALFARVSTALRNAVGVDLLDADSARAQGLDPARPLALAILTDPPGATLLALPGDTERLTARLDGVFRRRGSTPTQVETHAGVPIYAAERVGAGYLAIAGHVVVLNGIPRPDERLALARHIIDSGISGALSSSERFRSVRNRLPDDADILCYLAPSDSTLEAASLPPIPALQPLLAFARANGPHEGTALTARIGAERLTLSSFTRLDDPAASLAVRPPGERAHDPFLDRLPSTPFLAVQMNVDPEIIRAKLDALSARTAGTDTTVAAAPSHDGTTRLLDVLTGRVGLLANTVSIMGTDLVAYAEGMSAGAVGGVLDSLVVSLRAHPIALPMLGSTAKIQDDAEGGVPFYRLPLMPFAELCVGVVSDHLVLTTTRERMTTIIAGGSSFLATIPDTTVRAAIGKGKATAAYVDVAGFTRALGMLPLPQAEPYRNAMDVVKMFDHASAVGDVDADGYATTVDVVATRPDVWPRLIEAIFAARGRSS